MDADVNRIYHSPIKNNKNRKQNKQRSKYAVNNTYTNYDKTMNVTKPITPSFIHRINKIETERSMIQFDRQIETGRRQHDGFNHIENKIPAISLTDYRLLSGALEFSMKALKKGIQPIIGLDIDYIDNLNRS